MPITPSPHLASDHEALHREADAVARDEIAPLVARMENSPDRVERDVPLVFGERRWFGVTIPQEYGGMGAGHVAKTVLIHRLAAVSGAAAAILQAGLIPVAALLHFANDEQKRRWLPPAARGTALFSIAVTEPEAGGHLGGMQTTAERSGEEWVITGSKMHVGNSHLAHVHVVVARTAPPGTSTSRALTAFLVEHDRPGLTVRPHRPALGLHGFSFGRLDLDGVRVPAANVLGRVGEGMRVAQSSSILYGRPNLAAVSLGLHEATVELTTRFLRQRRRYDGTLYDLPVLRDRLGAMEARLRAARTLTYQAVALLDAGQPCDAELINSKYLGHDWAVESGQDAMELHGAHALATDYPLQRLWRDIQCTYAPAGTGEVQRIRLADAVLHDTPVQWSQLLTDGYSRPQPDPSTV
ncbi:acyl-CoA dehydrogenase family protein [Streptomyces thermoviolaceus]|uniref:acyl-CoA dehydrogenase family protein n=1 Tax=Streptomyces thermoviolaceus TaxID=1952 RepID=UPI00203BBC33|nr:acyl-CoA dehydrogenase family protein [Streptomyces thermoviolaceus]MCM3266345.1 acyl-CoA dehydrogenase family protein [Streptomyces thermoviolaceus]